jgi:hypothetical protein
MDNKEKLGFAVIGAQKCATTWIYDCLKDHPMLNLRNSKNEDYYYGGPYFMGNGKDDWYFRQFKKNQHLKGCVSVDYIEDVTIPDILYAHNSSIRLIVSLRNPAERAISAYQWYVRKGFLPNQRLNEGLLDLLLHYNGEVKSEFSDMYLNIIERGFYYKKLKSFLVKFPVEQIKVVFYDDIKSAPLPTLQKIMAFLKIKDNFIPPNIDTIPKKNTGIEPLIKLERQFPDSRIVRKLVDVGNQLLYKKISINTPFEKLNMGLMNELNLLYKKSNEDLVLMMNDFNSESSRVIQKNWLKAN